MTPANEPLTARRNARFVEEWTFKDGATPFNFTGYSGRLKVRLFGAQPVTRSRRSPR